MDSTHKMIRNACEELDKIAEKGLDRNNIDNAYKLAIIKEKLLRAEELMEAGESEYSGRGYSNARYSRDEMSNYSGRRYSRDGNSYDDGGDSYASRGQYYVRGHYSRDNGHSQDGYSRDGGRMENCKAEMMEALDMMERTADGQDKKKIMEYKRMIESMEV